MFSDNKVAHNINKIAGVSEEDVFKAKLAGEEVRFAGVSFSRLHDFVNFCIRTGLVSESYIVTNDFVIRNVLHDFSYSEHRKGGPRRMTWDAGDEVAIDTDGSMWL